MWSWNLQVHGNISDESGKKDMYASHLFQLKLLSHQNLTEKIEPATVSQAAMGNKKKFYLDQ